MRAGQRLFGIFLEDSSDLVAKPIPKFAMFGWNKRLSTPCLCPWEMLFLFRHKPDQEAAMWLNMVEAHQSAQPQKQNHDLAIPKAVLLVK